MVIDLDVGANIKILIAFINAFLYMVLVGLDLVNVINTFFLQEVPDLLHVVGVGSIQSHINVFYNICLWTLFDLIPFENFFFVLFFNYVFCGLEY